MSKGITPRAENYSNWYNDIVIKAGLADHSDVRGCMIIKPYGYAIWENMRDALDSRPRDTRPTLDQITAALGAFSSASDGTGDDEPAPRRTRRGRARA